MWILIEGHLSFCCYPFLALFLLTFSNSTTVHSLTMRFWLDCHVINRPICPNLANFNEHILCCRRISRNYFHYTHFFTYINNSKIYLGVYQTYHQINVTNLQKARKIVKLLKGNYFVNKCYTWYIKIENMSNQVYNLYTQNFSSLFELSIFLTNPFWCIITSRHV